MKRASRTRSPRIHRATLVFTAVVLFLPVASWAYWGAWRDGVLTAGAAVISGALGSVLMLFPIVLQKTKGMPIFRQDGGPA